MDDKALTASHRLSLLKAGHRRWMIRAAQERFMKALAGAGHYDEVEVLHRDTVAFSAYGAEVLA
jgi:hypothetical protein